ncbi:hypothetical protein [Burkholderia multivorans]|uniref:hypothetical protein n=1 Tax=Burkholderia multivorans TaxID=87883 RepID=UPI0028616871|nr:hypothetical protein [Burkholderia multivorans]MDR9065293.1 hypothetical protein [Burkholderia multivorans]MDR9091841.1 hypothetical protein [Burkholderia multivorans]MDR9117659.1 hypothetical protein [Burkholderia multivorans]MDR9157266.1 hypothetical protein [Burkholderia multivorans]MDR9164844.1 hypothetical protein [Burkholderia multivorans]
MNQDELDLLDWETRVFNAFQAVIDLLNPNLEARDAAKVQELLDFLVEEYNRAREALMARVAGRLQEARHGCAAH